MKFPTAILLLSGLFLISFFLPGSGQHNTAIPGKPVLESSENPTPGPLKIEKGEDVFMLTYFRQRYPTRIEIDAKGNTVEVPLPDPPYSVIDGTLLKYEDTFYLFHKEEEFGAKTGERRAIRLATAKHPEGPYQIVDGHLNNGQIVPVITEGPTIISDPEKPGWLLYYDYCMTNHFGASHSPDLIHWTVLRNVVFPPDARHGCVSRITAEEAEILINAYPF